MNDQMEQSILSLTSLVPTLMEHRRGTCLILEHEHGSLFVIKANSVFLVKERCLSCFHFRIKNGCGIGKDCKSICLIPEEQNYGWTNVSNLNPSSILLLAKFFTLSKDPLPDFIKEQIPSDFKDQRCRKHILAKPILNRTLAELDRQAAQIQMKKNSHSLPEKEYEDFLKEIEAEKRELHDRLALIL